MKDPKARKKVKNNVFREASPDYGKWRRSLFITNCVIGTGVFLLEIFVNLLLAVQGKILGDIGIHLLKYMIIPSGMIFLAVLFDSIMLRVFPRRDTLLNYVMVLTVVFMCSVVAMTHYVFPITMTAFLIPVLMSVVFGNKRLTTVTAACCFVCVILTGIWRNIDGTDTERNFVIQEVVISLGILLLSLIVARTVISLMVEQNQRLIVALQKEKVSQQEAESANKAKSSFLANMSHEIRTPINAILGMNEMILREEKDPAIREYAGNIQASGNSLLSIVNDVLDISKIESGKLEILTVDYEVNSLISDCFNMTAGRAREKSLELMVECSDNVPMKLCGDETRIRQIIVNLLTNAVKYTEKGTVKLTVGGEYTPEGFKLKFEVIDTGIGISEDNLTKLFTQFQRFDLQHNQNIEGTGLGLSIVKHLCDLMNGTVSAASVLGSGSTFTVVLPQRVVDGTPCGGIDLNYSISAEPEYRHSFEAPDAKVLAVDDLPVNLLVISNLLKNTRIRIDTAGSGRECLDKCSHEKYDLILMDHMMPEMDGVKTFELLHGDRSSPNCDTPVIMLTANALAGMREQYIDVGFADYVSKPVRGAKLEEAILRNLPERLIKPAVYDDPAISAAEEPSEFAELCRTIPELNIHTALEYCCGSAELLNDLLHDFAENDRPNDLRAAFEGKNWEKYRLNAHSLKSSSLTIGLIGLSERARASELAIKNGCEEFAEINHDPLMEEYGALLEKLKNYLKDKSEQNATVH